MKKRHKNLKINFAFWLTLLIVALGLLLFLFNRSFLKLNVLPNSAKIWVDDKAIQGGSLISLSPGKHSIRAESKGYIGKTVEINLRRALITKEKISLAETSEPEKVDNGTFLHRGEDERFAYYLGDNNTTLYRIDNKSGTLEKNRITNPVLSGIREIIWGPGEQLALFRKDNGVYLFDFMRYDFVNQKETLWGDANIGSIAWCPDNSKIAYFNTKDKTIIFSDISNKNKKRIVNLSEYGVDNPVLRWSPDSLNLLLVSRNRQYDTNKIYLLNASSLNLKEITEGGNQLDALYSPNGENIAFFTYQEEGDKNPVVVSVMNSSGTDQKTLGVRTDSKKTTWLDNDNLIIHKDNAETKKGEVFGINVNNKRISGFVIRGLSLRNPELVEQLSGGKIILYEENGVIFSLKTS